MRAADSAGGLGLACRSNPGVRGAGAPKNAAMHVIGHGIDIIEIARVARLLSKNDDFLLGWFAEAEYVELQKEGVRAVRVAEVVAAKEACAKALGTGFSGDMSWQDVRVHQPRVGNPQVELSGGALAAADVLEVTGFLVSVGHSTTLAVGSVLALGGQTIPR